MAPFRVSFSIASSGWSRPRDAGYRHQRDGQPHSLPTCFRISNHARRGTRVKSFAHAELPAGSSLTSSSLRESRCGQSLRKLRQHFVDISFHLVEVRGRFVRRSIRAAASVRSASASDAPRHSQTRPARRRRWRPKTPEARQIADHPRHRVAGTRVLGDVHPPSSKSRNEGGEKDRPP